MFQLELTDLSTHGLFLPKGETNTFLVIILVFVIGGIIWYFLNRQK